MKIQIVSLCLGLSVVKGAAMAAVLGSNASNLRSCMKNPQQTSYGKNECPCIGIDNMKGYYAVQMDFYHVQYSAEVGASCEAWDDGKHPACRGSVPPQWCKQSWCYVDPCNCNLEVLPKMTKSSTSYQGSPAYFSYNTCGGMDFYSQEMSPDACVMQKTQGDCAKNSDCAWNGKQCGGKEAVGTCKAASKMDVAVYGQEDCRCVGLGGRDVGKAFMHINQDDLVEYPANVGSTCHNWEGDAHPACKKDGEKPAFCSAKWCFVDPCKCKTAQPPYSVMGKNRVMRFQGKTAFWSYLTCGNKDTWTEESKSEYCIDQKTEQACGQMDGKCAWNGKECLGKALVEVCVKQRATGVLGYEEPFGGAHGHTLFMTLVVMIGAMMSA